MTIKECYAALNGNYEEATLRLMNDKLIERFMLKFPADNSITILRDAIAAQDWATAFRGAHTLKGVAANLAFSQLQADASELTEQLRDCATPADPALVAKVEASYDQVIAAIREYEAQKQ
ncbi:MAG: Hpt domain-containing protein [Lachnospiraceae bacterium]|nr:Hpt domain-containing protein [Lachnospiraceae bacterium]